MLARFYIVAIVAFVTAVVPGVIVDDIPSAEEAASIARTLVNRESLVNINTVKRVTNQDGSTRLLPFSSVEYYADCDNDGNPYWLVVEIGTTYQNILRGSDFSFTIRTGDHPSYEEVNVTYPGGIDKSPAGSPRINLSGRFNWNPFKLPLDLWRVQACFLERHPDAAGWLPNPGFGPHKSKWVKLEVDKVFFIGGFGDRAYIGDIESSLYHGARTIDEENKE